MTLDTSGRASLSLARAALLAMVFTLAWSPAAQAQPYAVTRHSIDGGGTAAGVAGGPYRIIGTIGQFEAGGPSAGGGLQMTGGYWSGPAGGGGCGLADIVSIGGLPPPDGLVTGDDFNAYIAAFAGDSPLADIVSIGGLPPPDGLVTGDDFNAFIAAFAAGCP